MTNQAVIDDATFEMLKNEMGADFIGELIQTYFEEVPRLFSQLLTALDQQDCEGFRRAAHSIKSTSNSMGALAFGEKARELEMLGKEGHLETAAEKVSQLVGGYPEVKQALEGRWHA